MIASRQVGAADRAGKQHVADDGETLFRIGKGNASRRMPRTMQHVVETARTFGMENAANVTPDLWLEEKDQVQVGELTFDVLHCPGHSPGSIAFVNAAQRLAIVGDVLFAGSIGRTDLPGGNHRQLLKSIRDKLLPLGDDVGIISGHGPTTTIGRERTSNPFLQ